MCRKEAERGNDVDSGVGAGATGKDDDEGEEAGRGDDEGENEDAREGRPFSLGKRKNDGDEGARRTATIEESVDCDTDNGAGSGGDGWDEAQVDGDEEEDEGDE